MRSLLHLYLRVRRRPLFEGIETVTLALVLSLALRMVAFQAFYIPSRSMAETLMPFDHIVAEKMTYLLRVPRRGEIVIFDFSLSGSGGLLPGALPAEAAGREGADRLAPQPDEAGWFERMAGGRDTRDRREFVKRVIGVAGDEIDYRDGVLRVNGVRQREAYLGSAGADAVERGAWAVRVPGRRIAFTESGVKIDGRPLADVLPPEVPLSSIVDRSPANFVRLRGGAIGILRVHVPAGHLYVMGDNRAESADSRWFGFLPVAAVHGRAIFTYWPPSRLKTLA